MKNVTIYRKIVQKTKNVFGLPKSSCLYWLIFGAVVLIAGGTIWWSWSENLKINNIEPVEIMESNLCGPEPPAVCAAGMRLTCEDGKWECREEKENSDISNWKTYRNEEYGFEVKYPIDFTIDKHLSNEDTIYFGSENDSFLINIDEGIDKGYQGANLLPFKDYAIQISKNTCDADGPNIAVYCEKISEPSFFHEINVAPAYEIYLKEIIQTQSGSDVQKTKGLIIAIDVSIHTQGLARGVFINSRGVSDNKELIKAVAATFKFIE